MSKSHHASRDIKKKPLHTLKEKKAMKQLKKHEHDTPPLIAPSQVTH
jgi:hypothetical protein